MQSGTIWRRRALLMLVIGLVIAIPLTLLLRNSGEDEPKPEAGSIAEEFPLNPAVGDTEIEAVYQVPKGWKLERKGEALTVISEDGAVRIGITSPDGEPAEILDSALAELESLYDNVQVKQGATKVGGKPAKGAVVSASQDGLDVRIVVAVSEGEKRDYLLEVLTAATAKPGDVGGAQRFLNSLEFEG